MTKFTRPLLVLACLGLIALGVLRSVEIRKPDRPVGSIEDLAGLAERDDLNLVFVVIDTLRADRLSAYGYERPTSPVLDALGQSGIRFENTLAQSTWTKTSMASLLTATYPAKNRVTRFNHVLPDGATLPSEILQQAGFRTVGIWRNGWVSGSFGFKQGFDVYFKPNRSQPNPLDNPSAANLAVTDRAIIDAATQFIRTSGHERFYLYLHLMDVHQYVYDGAVDFGTTYSDIYDQAIHFVDGTLGTLIAILQEEGLMKKTVLAVVSDHGEAFEEHGVEGHARDLYHENTRVPFVLTLPFRLEQPVVVRTPVENVDVWPTLLELLGLPALPEADGRSLVPLIEAAARGAEEPPSNGSRLRFAELDRHWGRPSYEPKPFLLIDDGRYRMHLPGEDPLELYDTATDPGERRDVSEKRPVEVRRLLDEIQGYAAAPEPSWGLPGWVEIDELEAQHLRALGYVIDPHAPPGKRIEH